MGLISFKCKKKKEPQQQSDTNQKDESLTNKLKTLSAETQGLVGVLASIGATDIRVYTKEEARNARPEDLSASTRKLLIRMDNGKYNEV